MAATPSVSLSADSSLGEGAFFILPLTILIICEQIKHNYAININIKRLEMNFSCFF